MSNIFYKNFNLSCFSKFKCLPNTTLSPPSPPPSPPSSPPHIQEDHNHPSSTTSSTMIKNFNSLYDPTSSNSTSKSHSSNFSSSSSCETDDSAEPDFATVYASQRFFFSSPGSSNSIFEYSPTAESDTLLNGGIAFSKYSPDPYSDFKRSMQEMVEAKELLDVKENWEYLNELLLCYLKLNPKHTHKYIIGAFTDLVVGLISSNIGSQRRKNVSRRLLL